jgi:hypothetical protein
VRVKEIDWIGMDRELVVSRNGSLAVDDLVRVRILDRSPRTRRSARGDEDDGPVATREGRHRIPVEDPSLTDRRR